MKYDIVKTRRKIIIKIIAMTSFAASRHSFVQTSRKKGKKRLFMYVILEGKYQKKEKYKQLLSQLHFIQRRKKNSRQHTDRYGFKRYTNQNTSTIELFFFLYYYDCAVIFVFLNSNEYKSILLIAFCIGRIQFHVYVWRIWWKKQMKNQLLR